MGEAASPTTRKILLLIFVISVLTLSSSQLLYSPNYGNSSQDNNLRPLGDTGKNQQFASDPSALPRPVNESATGTASNQFINLTQSVKDITTTLPPGWRASSITAIVYNLWDQRDWARNGAFTSDTSGSWTFSYSDKTPYSNEFGSGRTVNGSNAYIWGQIGDPISPYYFTYGDRWSWNQTINMPRGSAISARIQFRYYIDLADSLNNFDAEVYAWVGNARVGGIEFDQAQLPLRKWHWVTWDVPTSTISTPNVLVAVGFRFLATPYQSYSENFRWVPIFFDDVSLVVKAYAKPDQLQMKMLRGAAIADVTPIDWSKGTVTLTGFTVGPPTVQTSYQFSFTSNVSLPARSEFYANATIVPMSLTGAPTTFESQGAKAAWTMSFVTEFDQDNFAAGNTYYKKYYFNVSVPSDWNYTTCVDPVSKTHNIGSEADNFTVTTIASKKILTVNVTRIGAYSVYPGYVPYSVHAESFNYVKEVFTQLQSGSTWVNATNFYPTQTARFAAFIKGASPVSTGIANLTIHGPPTYGASPVVIEAFSGVAPVNGWANFTKTIPNTYAAGNYSAQVDWVDNSLGEAGSLTCAFNVTHRFRAFLLIPGDGDVVLADSYIINPSSTAKIFDYYTNETITATVKGRASWEPPGTWNSYTYSPSNGTYLNTTHVGSLSVGTRAWIAINASKTFYDLATVNNTVWIGQGTTCTPSSQSFTVRYTESASNNVKPSVLYLYTNATVVSSATLTLLGEISSNDSLIQWTQRSENDLSQSGSGVYASKLYVGTLSGTLKGIPAGNTYTVWFKLTKGQYTQTKTFSARVTVLTQPTQMAAWGVSERTVFWGETAQYSLNFSTRLAGSFDWPTTTRTYNYSNYVPPYVTVSCDWTYGWKVEESTYYRGTYVLSLYTSSYPTPTDDGTGQGTAEVNIQFHKSNYDDPEAKLVTLHVKRLTTSMTGAVWNGAVYTSTNNTSVYPGDSKFIFVWYNDTHTGVPIGVGGSTITYTSSGGNILGSGTLNAVAGTPGLYNLTLSGATTNQIPGTHQIYLVGSNSPHYVQRSITVTLNILPITSTLQAQNPATSAYYGQRLVFLIWFNDTHNNLPIGGATIQVSTVPAMSIISPYEVPGIPGLYNLTIPGGQGTGSYSITISSNKTKYADGSTVLSLSINSLPTTLTPYTIAGDGSYLFRPNATVQIGGDLTIYLWFNDTYNQVPILGVGTSITFTSDKFGNGWLQAVSGTPGLYELTVHCSDAGGWPITFTVNAPGYQSHTFVFTVIVQAPSGGFTATQLAIMGFGSGGVVLAAMLGYVFVKRARVPFIIKKIDESLKLISKGDHEAATPVALRSREEIVVAITQERIDVFGRRPAGPEAAGEGVAETVASAATTETSALKKELEAVEPKEKSGDVIEEVEMDTLDEELQRLEKFEDKESLPDGAKEVRDIVEKYKESKKKKK